MASSSGGSEAREAKAQQLLSEAERKVREPKGFLSNLVGYVFSQQSVTECNLIPSDPPRNSNRVEEAIDLYGRAGNMFKSAEKWSAAGKAFLEAASLHLKSGNKLEAANSYVDVATCHRKSDPQEAVNYYLKAIDICTDMARFSSAAKHHMSIAEIYETDMVDLKKAIHHFELAADLFKKEESSTSANQCLLHVARHAAQLEDYSKAIEIYEQVGANCPDDAQTSHGAPAWHIEKIKLYQRLALALFQDDVQQVLEWIDTHGEGFLKKNLGVGRNLQKARTLQRSHEHFESVAKNTFTNAEKLLAAAEEFAQTGECNAEEIYRVARHLETHISMFAKKVERRRTCLHLAVMFFTHEKELASWLEELQQDYHNNVETPIQAPDSVEACEAALEQLHSQRNSMIAGVLSTISEGQSLLDELRKQQQQYSPSSVTGENANVISNGDVGPSSSTTASLDSSNAMSASFHSLSNSIATIETMLERIKVFKTKMEELLNSKKFKFELCHQLRHFEREALNVCNQFDLWVEEIKRSEAKQFTPVDVAQAEKMLQMHGDNFSNIQQLAFDVLQRGQELSQVREL